MARVSSAVRKRFVASFIFHRAPTPLPKPCASEKNMLLYKSMYSFFSEIFTFSMQIRQNSCVSMLLYERRRFDGGVSLSMQLGQGMSPTFARKRGSYSVRHCTVRSVFRYLVRASLKFRIWIGSSSGAALAVTPCVPCSASHFDQFSLFQIYLTT